MPSNPGDAPILRDLEPRTPRLEVIDLDDQRSVFLGGHLVARYPCEEKGTDRVVMTQLACVLPLQDKDIAASFGVHAVSLSRFCGQARSGGAAALMPRRPGPKGPSKVTPKLEARCRQLREEGLSSRAIAARVSRPGRPISHVTVAVLFKGEKGQSKQQPLAFEALVEPDEHPTSNAEAVFGQARSTRYAGALMLYAGLARLDLWGAFQRLGVMTGPARRYGWAQTIAAVVFCFALRFRSIEDSKNALRKDLGTLIGQDRGPSVVNLRFKIKALAESVDPAALSRELFRRYLQLEPVWEGLYYVDGHFCPYHGEHPTPKGWDAKRRLAVKGHTDVYIHDARGRALFFFSQPLNDSLARALPKAVQEIRQAHGSGPFTLVFDRGGYSGDAFRYFHEQGIGFITYLKGRKPRRCSPQARFKRGWFLFEGKRRFYRLFEKKQRSGPASSIRTILFLGDEDQQIPVLTNLAGSSRAAKVVHCLRLRWRQENGFKFLAENYAIDQIVQYGADEETQNRLVPNSRRRALKEQLRTTIKEIQDLEAQLGRALNDNAEAQRPTVRGVKIAHAPLRQRIAKRRQVLARLENRLRHTPAQISADTVDRRRSLLREDRRLVVNTLKIAAYNAERMLALRFNHFYQRPKDALSIFRSLLQLPGEVQLSTPGHLEVRLRRPDSSKVADALEALIAEINVDAPRLLDDGPTLNFSLAS